MSHNYPHVGGYVMAPAPGHARAHKGYVFEHILVVERAIGRLLRRPECVHHINGDRADNRGANLVACQDQAYHSLLHQRARALAACGHAAWLTCNYCKQWADPVQLYVGRPSRGRLAGVYHRACRAAHRRAA